MSDVVNNSNIDCLQGNITLLFLLLMIEFNLF